MNILTNIFAATKQIKELETKLADVSKQLGEQTKLKDDAWKSFEEYKAETSTLLDVKMKYDNEIVALKDTHSKEVSSIKEASLKELNDIKVSHDLAVKDLIAKYEDTIKTLNTEMEKETSSTNKKVHLELSTLGISADKIPMANMDIEENIVAQFMAMNPGTDRLKFTEQHKAILNKYNK